jgi:hypothetical protein
MVGESGLRAARVGHRVAAATRFFDFRNRRLP